MTEPRTRPWDPTTIEVHNLHDVRRLLEKIVFDTDMKRNRWGLWSHAQNALEFLNVHRQPVYIVLGEPGPEQQFVEVENIKGVGILLAPGQEPYPGKPGLWRLGPLWPFPAEPGPNPVPGTEARTEPTGAPDVASGEVPPGSPAPTTERTVLDSHELLIASTEEADAICTCGGWRLLRVSAPGQESSGQRLGDIEAAFKVHLDSVRTLEVNPPEQTA